ncbi:hypothetical protein AB9C52_32295, partial [Burkholderia cenocepacia]|uniref:hypothetical protein n=1 Tax=Burkholderia cenocepacia TaxID=95486 RepID=UPI00350F2083
ATDAHACRRRNTSGRPAACRFRKPTPASKRNIVHAHEAGARLPVRAGVRPSYGFSSTRRASCRDAGARVHNKKEAT